MDLSTPGHSVSPHKAFAELISLEWCTSPEIQRVFLRDLTAVARQWNTGAPGRMAELERLKRRWCVSHHQWQPFLNDFFWFTRLLGLDPLEKPAIGV